MSLENEIKKLTASIEAQNVLLEGFIGQIVTSTNNATVEAPVAKAIPASEKVEQTELNPADVFDFAKTLAKKHGSPKVKKIIQKYGNKMADIESKDIANFHDDLCELEK